MSEETGGIEKVKSILENPAIKKAFRDALKIKIEDVPGVPDSLVEIFLLDEMPDNLDEANPDIRLYVPGMLAVLGWVREFKKFQFCRVQRHRKNERSMLYDSIANPPPNTTPPISKTTERAIDSYIETQPEIKKLNDEYDEAEYEKNLLCMAYDVLDRYNANLNEHLRQEVKDEHSQRIRRFRVEKEKEQNEEKAKEQKRLKTGINKALKKKKKKKVRLEDPDL